MKRLAYVVAATLAAAGIALAGSGIASAVPAHHHVADGSDVYMHT